MRVIEANYRVPLYGENDERFIDHIQERVTRTFADELVKELSESMGGVILSPVRTIVKRETDFLSDQQLATVRVYANVVDLPEPPQYRLVGGPADGFLVRTNGDRIWLVPVAPSPASVFSLVDPQPRVTLLVAEYERQDMSSAYFYKRTYER